MAETCKYLRQISAWFDGELPEHEARIIEAHIAGCDACTIELERLESLSRLLKGTSLPAIPRDVLADLHQNIEVLREGSILRMAKVLTAVAAAILIVCGGWLYDSTAATQEGTAAATTWEEAAVSLKMDASSEPQDVAQWIIKGLSVENGNE